jgi:DNA mismatch repair ATPase MutS
LGGPRFSKQYRRLIRRAGRTTLVFCQVGRFIEFYGPRREAAAQALRLVRVSIARGGYGFSVGFPVSLRERYVSVAVRAGYAVAEVREAGRLAPRCAARGVVAVWLPSKVSQSGAPPRGSPSRHDAT